MDVSKDLPHEKDFDLDSYVQDQIKKYCNK